MRDFQNPQALADYLLYLDKNTTAYNSFFNWKKYVSFTDFESHFRDICDMCIQLNLEDHVGIKKKVVHDIASYWSKHENCQYTSFLAVYLYIFIFVFISISFVIIYLLKHLLKIKSCYKIDILYRS